MSKYSILITDCDHGYLSPEEDVAASRGARLVFAAGDTARIEAELACADALLTQYVQVTAALLQRAPQCRVIGRYGVGVDNIDLEAARGRNIEIVNVPDFCYEEVADHTMMLALSALRRTSMLDRAWRQDPSGFAERWSERFELLDGVERSRGLTLGLVGFGRTGRAVAARALPFGFNVLAHDPYVAEHEFATAGVRSASLPDLLGESDVVSLHVPATASTDQLIDASALEQVKAGVVIINTARGSLLDEDALLAALRAGRIGFAALDVTAQEPLPPGHPLLAEPRLLLTPHVAFFSRSSIEELKRSAIEGVLDALERPR